MEALTPMQAMKAMEKMMAEQMKMHTKMMAQMATYKNEYSPDGLATPTPSNPEVVSDSPDDEGFAPPQKKLRRSPRRHKNKPHDKKPATENHVGMLKRTLSWAKASSQGKRTPKGPKVCTYYSIAINI